MGQFVWPGYENLMKKMPHWEDFEKYHKKLDGSLERHCHRVFKIITEPSGFRVLNHGDFHAKNMMYRNDGLIEKDVYFVSILY